MTSLTQLLRETHSRISTPTSQCGTGFGIHKAAGWRFPNTTLLGILSPRCAIQLLGFHQESDGERSIHPRLPSMQFHPAKPSHHLMLHVMASSDVQFHWRGGGRWSGAKLSLKAAGACLWTDVNVWVGTPESQSLGEGDRVGRAEEAGEQLESWNPSLVTLPYVLVAGNRMLLGHVTLLGAFERVWGCEDHKRNKESGLRMENGCPCPPS